MQTLSLPADAESPSTTPVADLAAKNWNANLAAIARIQPDLLPMLGSMPDDLQWTLGRDGSLTGLDRHGMWWLNCSLPRRAGEAMLRKMVVGGTVACFLQPDHAGHLSAALGKLRREQAIIAVMPRNELLRVALASENFSAEIEAHRLWFVTRENWPEHLAALFDANPGLPTPTHFVRLKTSPDAAIEVLMGQAQRVFAAQSAKRSELARAIVTGPADCASASEGPPAEAGSPNASGVCVIAPSRFRLWDDAGCVLANELAKSGAAGIARYDADDPRSASPLGLAMAASRAAAIVTADLGRTDLQGIVSMTKSWITWITQPRVPAFDPAATGDAIVLADAAWRSIATAAGWAEGRVAVAEWPDADPALRRTPEPALGNKILAMIVDTRGTDATVELEQFSSHRLLWELIASELAKDPFALGDDPAAYLSARMRKIDIAQDNLDRRAFLENLIQPAYAQSLARTLLRGGVSLKLFGDGWADIEEFRSAAAGTIRSREDLLAAAASVGGLIHCWPGQVAHPIASLGRPILTPQRRETLLNDAHRLTLASNNSTKAKANLAAIVLDLAIIQPR